MIGEINKKQHLKIASDNSSKKCYLRYSRHHSLNECNIGSFDEFIIDHFLFTNNLIDSLEVVSL